MGIARRYIVLRGLALVALAVSAALLVNHFYPNPRLCGFESDCADVLSSRFGAPLGVPLPLFGVVGFAVLFGLSLFPTSRAGRLLRPLALVAGGAGLFLFLVQILALQRLCRFCLLVDAAAVAIAIVELAWGRGIASATAVRFRLAWLAGGLMALGLGAGFGAAGGGTEGEGGPVPPQISALWVSGKVNVVEVADFECPHCRRMHAVLRQFLAEEDERIHFVRLTAPMPAHAQARHASRAFLCACEQGQGDEMAEALFRAPNLAPESCEALAVNLGLSLPAYRTCTAAQATDERLDANLAWVKAACPQGLPVVWVQDRMLSGLRSIDELRAAARAAEKRL
jgi:uncharacterized membrane protein